jgi:hypothetical protein
MAQDKVFRICCKQFLSARDIRPRRAPKRDNSRVIMLPPPAAGLQVVSIGSLKDALAKMDIKASVEDTIPAQAYRQFTVLA